MRNIIGPTVLGITFFVAARPYAQDDVVMQAMRDELARSVSSLQIPGMEKPYFISYRVDERQSTGASASLGSLLRSSESRGRTLTVELRVGDYAFDNTNFLSLPTMRTGVVTLFGGMVPLPREDDYPELRRQVWLAIDGAYKKALEDLAKKRAAVQNKTLSENVPDFARQPPASVTDVEAPLALDRPQIESLLRELSALFKSMPHVARSSVRLDVTNTLTRYVNSEGTSYVRRRPRLELVALGEGQAPDGAPVEDFVAVYGRTRDDLPKREDFAERIREMGANLEKLRQAPLLDRYTGPVLFEGQGAAELLAQAVLPRVLAYRRPVAENPRFERTYSRPGETWNESLGEKVLPDFVTMIDNPALNELQNSRLVGGYKVDDEGVPARETELVSRGVLKNLLSTRSLVTGITQSSGNRRGARALPTNVIVTAADGLDDGEMRTELLRLAKAQGKDYAVIVRRLANPALRSAGDPMELGLSMASGEGNRIENTILAYRIYADGREELVRSAELTGVTALTFKHIVAASKTRTVLSAPFTILTGGLTFGPPERGQSVVSLVVPSLLFDEMTLRKPSGDLPKPPVIPRPSTN